MILVFIKNLKLCVTDNTVDTLSSIMGRLTFTVHPLCHIRNEPSNPQQCYGCAQWSYIGTHGGNATREPEVKRRTSYIGCGRKKLLNICHESLVVPLGVLAKEAKVVSAFHVDNLKNISKKRRSICSYKSPQYFQTLKLIQE